MSEHLEEQALGLGIDLGFRHRWNLSCGQARGFGRRDY